ncbi:hypothetical protein SAMN04488103_102330 [Gemmobacter aquatilis]|uniref:Uncharacterized protein n=1 Tax=Gemmobacter aquatilis TaxID=933059 RepID=A0A1H8BZB0_9RHOB|nr:hypothetical protein SAMN04488103_102330 [Gemmobacter aquatilis]
MAWQSMSGLRANADGRNKSLFRRIAVKPCFLDSWDEIRAGTRQKQRTRSCCSSRRIMGRHLFCRIRNCRVLHGGKLLDAYTIFFPAHRHRNYAAGCVQRSLLGVLHLLPETPSRTWLLGSRSWNGSFFRLVCVRARSGNFCPVSQLPLGVQQKAAMDSNQPHPPRRADRIKPQAMSPHKATNPGRSHFVSRSATGCFQTCHRALCSR